MWTGRNITKLNPTNIQFFFKQIINSYIVFYSVIAVFMSFIITCTKTLNIHAYFSTTFFHQPQDLKKTLIGFFLITHFIPSMHILILTNNIYVGRVAQSV